MSTQTKIFMTGVTGYIGGSVLLRFLEHPDFSSFGITALIRSQEKAAQLEALGINSVVGSLQNSSLLEELSANADVVVSMADCDDLVAAKAMLRGLKKHYTETGSIPLLIHTSGTSVLADSAAGDFLSDPTVYDDLNPAQIENLPHTQQHRPVDLEIVQADKEGYVKTYIILPSTIYGRPRGLLVEQGIQNAYSIQIPSLIRAGLARGRGGMVGAGQNIWPNVHVDDNADLYLLVFNHVRKDPDSIGHGRKGFYFAENGEHNLYQVGKAIAEAVIAVGKASGSNPKPSTFTDQEIQDLFQGSTFWGTNSRCRANRSRSIGWKPTRTTFDLLTSVLPDVEDLARH